MKPLRTCEKGHKFYKSSDCPACPVCEEKRKPSGEFLATLAAPARRALENNGITNLHQLSTFTEAEILKLHGMGKSTIIRLRSVLAENNLSFKS